MGNNNENLALYRERFGYWYFINKLLIISFGSIIIAIGYVFFQIPFDLAAGGIQGLSIIINNFISVNEGILYLLFNIPLLILGYYKLGRLQFLIFTVLSVIVFSLATYLLLRFAYPILKENPMTEDMLLSSIYAGVISGIGTGLVMKAGGSVGGTNVIAKLVHKKFGFPLSQTYLITDGIIILIAAFVFSWNVALHAILCLFINGIASDYAFEGPSIIRIATIITDKRDEVASILMSGLQRGVSCWEIEGTYTGKKHYMLYCAIYRSQVVLLKSLVAEADENAFVIIGEGKQALGEGFYSIKRV
ncbi:MAG: YitT family protein [Deferribacterota bacterium]|nr:YitT family protein [Deferribacterota bacterium]